MARPSKHNIHRELWSTPFLENGNLQTSYNNLLFYHAIGNEIIKNNSKYTLFNSTTKELDKKINNLIQSSDIQHKLIHNLNIQIDKSYLKDREYLKKKLEKLAQSIELLSSISSATNNKKITISDFYDFTRYIYSVKLTNEDYLCDLLNVNLETITRISGTQTFKDNLSERCSDNVVLFNIAVLLIVEKDSQHTLFYFLRDNIYNEIWKNYNTNMSKFETLEMLIKNLKELNLHRLQFSDEFMYAFLFYCHHVKSYHALKSKIKACNDYFSSINSLLEKKTYNLIEMHFEQSQCSKLYTYLLTPFVNNVNATNTKNKLIEANNRFLIEKKQFQIQSKQYKTLFDELILEYINLTPLISNQIALDESNEIISYNHNELEDIYEIISLLMGNNPSRILTLLDSYNNSDNIENILLIIYNLLFLDADICNAFISIYENKMNYCISQFPSKHKKTTNKKELIKFLHEHRLNYIYLRLLMFIDYNALSLKEWNFLLNLPYVADFEYDFLLNFQNLIISYRGNEAFTSIEDIKNYFAE